MEQKHFKMIRKKILLSMILVPVIPFVLILGIGYYYFVTSLETNTIASMKRISADHREIIESFLTERRSDLEFIAGSYTFQELSRPKALAEVFNRLQGKSDAFIDLGIFNDAGLHVAYHGPYRLTGKIYKDTQWFQEVMKHGYYISDVFLGYRKVPHFVIAVAHEEKGNKWVIRSTIDTFRFNNLVRQVHIGKTGEAYLLNAEGMLQTERHSGGNLMDKPLDGIQYPESHRSIKSFIDKDANGVKYLYATTWMKDKKWLLVIRQEKADAFEALTSAAYLIILIAVIGGSVIISVAFYLTNGIVKRMTQMDEEKDQLGQQLIRASRLAEIGEMATGFAHEINNPLQIMKSEQSLIEIFLSELKGNGQLSQSETLVELEDSLDQIGLQINRCARITQSILKFGRQSDPVAVDVDFKQFVPEVTAMVAKKASVNGISLKENVSEDTPLIHVDPGQLQQVFLNLFNNAIDAIIERHGSSGGKLIVESGPKENGKVEIAVRDNGQGISPEDLKKIFSPFFTTKPVGKGTGLGLSVCYGIVESMGGVMDVSSEKGVGTTFTITLPAAISAGL